MMVHNHLLLAGAGAWSASLLVPGWTVDIGPHYWAIVMLGALVPDLDTHHSYLGRRLPFISIPLGLLVGHRTFTHSVWPIMIAITLGYSLEAIWLYWLAFGMFLHLAGDFVTNTGIPLLWPLPKRMSSGLTVSTGGLLEFAMAAFIVAVIYAATSFALTGGIQWIH